MKIRYRRIVWTIVVAATFAAAASVGIPTASAQQVGTCPRSTGEAYLDANNVSARIVNTGGLFYRGEPHEYRVPRFGTSNALFNATIWVGGMINDELHISASLYGRNEFWAGPLDDEGNPPENCSEYDRLYKVDEADILDYETTGIAAPDLADWPTGLGAPTADASGQPIDLSNLPFVERRDRVIILASGERPILEGDQSIWWVMNDRGNTHESTDSAPIGMEVHATAFAAATSLNSVNDATFYRYRLTNRNNSRLDDAYFGIFSDVDLGDFDDDYIGSDTTLSIAFVYNSDNDDAGSAGYGTPVPALGFHLFQGPEAPLDNVDNDKDGTVDEQGERHQMTSFMFITDGGDVTESPVTGAHYYGYMQGLWKDNQPMTFGGDGRNFSEIPTKFFFPGDPVTGAFWSELNIDGLGTRKETYDRRLSLATGPFTLEPGESTEIVFSIVWALGADNLDSITKMREAAVEARAAYENGFRNLPKGLPPTETVSLLSPADGVFGQPLDVMFHWNSVSDAPSHQIELSSESTGTKTYKTNKTNIQILDLSEDEYYSWRVRSENVHGLGPWSPSRWLITGTLSFVSQKFPFSSFTVTANSAGPLVPPDVASFGFNGFPEIPCPLDLTEECAGPTSGYQQSTNDERWAIHAQGTITPYGPILSESSFLGIATQQGGNLGAIGSFDYELRFTERGGKALRLLEDGPLMGVPFELWNTGYHSPSDPSDDFRLIPAICESACGAGQTDFLFDISGDHSGSGSNNDPFTDWITWYNPVNITPGESGYDAFIDGTDELGTEVFRDMVLVLWNGGREPPYTALMPEEGTVFRIEVGNPMAPILASPSNQGLSRTDRVSFFWTGFSEDVFRIQVSLDPSFSSGVVENFVETGHTLELGERGRYYWRVQSSSGAWSQTWSFFVLAVTTDVDRLNDGTSPIEIVLFENYPNPFNRTTKIRYTLPYADEIQIGLFDMLGRRIRVLEQGLQLSGDHEIELDSYTLASGIYFYTLTAGDFTQTRKMVVVK